MDLKKYVSVKNQTFNHNTSIGPDITHLSIMKKKWKYRGEGNANLVLALPEERVILRLHKTRRDCHITEDLEYEEMTRVCREAFFCRTVMVPLLGKVYIQPPVVARVEHKEIHQLDHLLLPQRPSFRHHKGISFGYANIYPDYAMLPEALMQCTPPILGTHPPAVTCSLRGRCAHLRETLAHDHVLEDVSRVPITIANVLLQKCVKKECILSDPVHNNDFCQLLSKQSKAFNSWHNYRSQLAPHMPTEPTFCVEIKPKQGWVPNSQLQPPKCTFCLNQYLKLNNGAISRISQYCPLDLFSGDEKRIKKAILALLQTPQNNLKIFKDSYMVYSDESSQKDLSQTLQQWLDPCSNIPQDESPNLTDRFCSMVHYALTKDLLGSVDCEEPAVEHQSAPLISLSHDLPQPGLQPCDLSSYPLPANCILDRILRIQKLQQCDTDTIHHMLCQYGACDDYDYVTKLRDPDTGALCLDPVQSYLLATTAKDCSILIAFQRLRSKDSVGAEHVVVESSGGSQFVFNIGVSDLDPKPLSCVQKHRKRNTDIQHACSLPLH